jgi:hypothetical protein
MCAPLKAPHPETRLHVSTRQANLAAPRHSADSLRHGQWALHAMCCHASSHPHRRRQPARYSSAAQHIELPRFIESIAAGSRAGVCGACTRATTQTDASMGSARRGGVGGAARKAMRCTHPPLHNARGREARRLQPIAPRFGIADGGRRRITLCKHAPTAKSWAGRAAACGKTPEVWGGAPTPAGNACT